jgi:hypothetical protein
MGSTRKFRVIAERSIGIYCFAKSLSGVISIWARDDVLDPIIEGSTHLLGAGVNRNRLGNFVVIRLKTQIGANSLLRT